MNSSFPNRSLLRALNRVASASLLLGILAQKPALAAEKFSWDSSGQGSHVTSLAVDKRGAVWVGLQDWAVWTRNVGAGDARWKQFTVNDGLGDNDAYALACDQQGRVWVGHLNHGVSVWNGQGWMNYGALDGPPGERVFDIEVCPTNGDVWMATDAGLGRYSASQDKWSSFSRADGMASDQVNAIAFDKSGNIFCATPADGLMVARATNNYANWTNVRAQTQMPNRASGAGLPSNIVNDVLVARGTRDGAGAGAVYASTINGLAWSRDAGKNWRFVRGADWRANVKGHAKKTLVVEVPIDEDELLLEDWTTTLAENRAGLIWVGHRQRGFEARDPRTMRAAFTSSDKLTREGDDYVRALLDASGSGLLIGRYGGSNPGVASLGATGFAPAAENASSDAPAESGGATPVWFPSPATPPGAAQLKAMRTRLSAFSTPLQPGEAAFLGDDWATQGDWVGRYGRGHATLAAMNGSSYYSRQLKNKPDHVLNGAPGYSVRAQDGVRGIGETKMIHGVLWDRTDYGRVLYDPLLGYRRHAEWSDYNSDRNAYPWAFDGPDLWITVQVPAGLHRASLYFFNRNGQYDINRYRDFPIELKSIPTAKPSPNAASRARIRQQLLQRESALQRQLIAARKKYPSQSPQVKALYERWVWLQEAVLGESFLLMTDLKAIDASPTLARTRVSDFWGGVYKQFALRGPATFHFKIARNHSHGTICQGVFLDAMPAAGQPQAAPKPLSWMKGVAYDAPAIQDTVLETAPRDAAQLAAARALWAQLDAAAWKKGGLGVQRPMRLQALRAAIIADAPPTLIANWRWKLALWNDAEREQWRETMARAFPVK